jgi:hypothetical protein
MTTDNSLVIINESPIVPEYFRIIKESYDKANHKHNIRAETVYQTVGEYNKNRRIYSNDLMNEAIEMNRPKMKSRTFLGELDHPITEDMVRQSTVLYKEASHVMTDLKIDGKYIRGVFETLSTPNGYTMAGLIKDNIPVGFSLRAMGNLIPEGEYFRAAKPFIMICYDCVSHPSHVEARLTNVMKENFSCIGDQCKKMFIDNKIDMELSKVFKKFF